jgi:hypothetical protein
VVPAQRSRLMRADHPKASPSGSPRPR